MLRRSMVLHAHSEFVGTARRAVRRGRTVSITAAVPVPSASPLSAAVRVGIVSYNTADLLDRCLAALPGRARRPRRRDRCRRQRVRRRERRPRPALGGGDGHREPSQRGLRPGDEPGPGGDGRPRARRPEPRHRCGTRLVGAPGAPPRRRADRPAGDAAAPQRRRLGPALGPSLPVDHQPRSPWVWCRSGGAVGSDGGSGWRATPTSIEPARARLGHRCRARHPPGCPGRRRPARTASGGSCTRRTWTCAGDSGRRLESRARAGCGRPSCRQRRRRRGVGRRPRRPLARRAVRLVRRDQGRRRRPPVGERPGARAARQAPGACRPDDPRAGPPSCAACCASTPPRPFAPAGGSCGTRPPTRCDRSSSPAAGPNSWPVRPATCGDAGRGPPGRARVQGPLAGHPRRRWPAPSSRGRRRGAGWTSGSWRSSPCTTRLDILAGTSTTWPPMGSTSMSSTTGRTTARTSSPLERVGAGRLAVERYPADRPADYYDWTGLLHRVRGARQGGRRRLVRPPRRRRAPPAALARPHAPRGSVAACSPRALPPSTTRSSSSTPSTTRSARATISRPHLRHWARTHVGENRLQRKAWKASPVVDLATSGGHDATFPGRLVHPYNFLLRHYPIRSQRHGEDKVLR